MDTNSEGTKKLQLSAAVNAAGAATVVVFCLARCTPDPQIGYAAAAEDSLPPECAAEAAPLPGNPPSTPMAATVIRTSSPTAQRS